MWLSDKHDVCPYLLLSLFLWLGEHPMLSRYSEQARASDSIEKKRAVWSCESCMLPRTPIVSIKKRQLSTAPYFAAIWRPAWGTHTINNKQLIERGGVYLLPVSPLSSLALGLPPRDINSCRQSWLSRNETISLMCYSKTELFYTKEFSLGIIV